MMTETRKFKITWTLTYKSGETCEGYTTLVSESIESAIARLHENRRIGTYKVHGVQDLGKAELVSVNRNHFVTQGNLG